MGACTSAFLLLKPNTSFCYKIWERDIRKLEWIWG
ncbi:uncharacterized protein J3R85_007812 [Psidium guajava]|nr:uncharacterized protein J3R85_007812 [Psidium guajava]